MFIFNYNLFKLIFYIGFPIALTFPHFYKADPSLLNAVVGLDPRQDLHESYFLIQPKSGLPVDLAFRFQINMALQDIKAISNTDGFSNMVLPLLWFEIVSLKFIFMKLIKLIYQNTFDNL